uniref:Uncharacterized protein n=1 Tax=Arundo donax TaxID=35708 RepID=A0A0A9AYB8_ARUDO
MWKWNTKG